MSESPFKNESLRFDIRLARPFEWQDYRNIRLKAINSEDSTMLGHVNAEKQKDRVEDDAYWQKDVASDNKDKIVVLAWVGTKAVGMSVADKDKSGWSMGSAYVEENVRDQGINKKMFALRLKEILKRGGESVKLAIMTGNEPSLHISRDLFKAEFIEEIEVAGKTWYLFEIDLTRPEVIKKINEVLNAG